jgi:hypothetical protein
MTTALTVRAVDDGTVLDTVTLADSDLHYATGHARRMFEGARAQGRTAQQVMDRFHGWSNGYIVVNAENTE